MADFDKSKFDPKAAAEARKQELGRFVKKGEKGIHVMAPAPYKIEREQDKLDGNGKPMLDADGEPVKEKVEVKVNAFKPVSTFDMFL